MERLTEKRNGTNVIPLRNAICGTDMPYWKITTAGDLTEYLSGNAADRLAAYEDTGLDPEEIKDFMSRWKDAVELAGLCKEAGSDRLRELAEADKDGRCVVLPCSLGKKVWSGKWRDDLSECVYVCASSMLSDIERGNVIRYTRKAAEAALKGE